MSATVPGVGQITIRKCDSMEELQACVALQKEVWNFDDVDLIPKRMFVVAHKIGGQVIGSFDGDGLIGFALSIPGSRNGKRYQDIQELLQAGIHVISTLNIQHLESLYDIVEQATGVKVKERVPDYVLGMADQLVNVDLSAEDLQERMRAGKVYPAERVESALNNFFTGPNLTRLRELALEEIRHLLDKRRQGEKEDSAAGAGRVMVCLSSRSPNPHLLLRKGARLADRLHAPWYAVYVRTPREGPARVDAGPDPKLTLAEKESTQRFLEAGGSVQSEEAVELGLRWLRYVVNHGLPLGVQVNYYLYPT